MSYQAISIDTSLKINYKITCFALNYVSHQIFICDKEFVRTFDLEHNILLKEFNYVQKFYEIYETRIKIKSADCHVLNNLWVTFVNERSFLFFNESLQYSKIFQAEPNPAASLTVLQRYDEIITLRSDRKMLKFWKFELLDDLEVEALEREDQFNRERKELTRSKKTVHEQLVESNYKNFQKRISQNYESEKARLLSKMSFPLHLSLFNRRGHIQPAGNRVIMQFCISEELKMLPVSFDTQEVFIYHLFTCEVLQTIDMNKVSLTVLESPAYQGLINVAIDQEFLYYCDEKKFTVRDLLTQEEHTMPMPNIGKVVALYAERSNQAGGIYMVTTDDKIHCFSYSNSNTIN